MHTSPTLPEPAAPATPTPSFGALLTVAEVAAYLRVSEMTVYRLISSAEIPASKVGRVYRIVAQDLAQYLDGQRVPRAS